MLLTFWNTRIRVGVAPTSIRTPRPRGRVGRERPRHPSGPGTATTSLIEEDVAPGDRSPDANTKTGGDVNEADDKQQEKSTRHNGLDRHELNQHADEQHHREHVIQDGAPACAAGRFQHVDQEYDNRTRNNRVAWRDPPLTPRNHVNMPDLVGPREPR